MKIAAPSVLLFDLGGVLIENATFQELAALLPGAIETSDLHDRWLDSPSVQHFERGLTTADEFSIAFVSEWGLEISSEQFLAIFASWPKAPYPGALELLARLHSDFTIAFLSNCNVVHWQRLQEVLRYADRAFSSHQLGVVKPDVEIFDRVVRELDCLPEQVCFFDDTLKNVRAARSVGMGAHHTVGFGALHGTISSLGLFAPC